MGDESESRRLPKMEPKMNFVIARIGARMCFRTAVLAAVALTLISCINDNSAYPVASAGQGGVTVRKQEMPRSARPAATEPAGPTAREVELQRKIDAMEARSRELEEQSRAMQVELQRLKQE